MAVLSDPKLKEFTLQPSMGYLIKVDDRNKATMADGLFREEVLEAHTASNELYGRPTGVVPPAWSRITWLIGLFIAALLVFLFTANFARKETVRGKLRPDGSEARVYAVESGIVKQVLIADGAIVEAGTPLATIASDRILDDGDSLSDNALSALSLEQTLLNDRLSELRAAAQIAEDDLAQRVADAARQESEGRAQLAVLVQRLQTARHRATDTERFLDEGLITAAEHMQRTDDVAVLDQSRLQLEAQISAAEAAQSRLVIEKRRIRSDLNRDQADIGQRLAQLDSQMRQTEASAMHLVTAPMSGKVTALQARVGERADPTIPLLAIGPPGAELIAELHVPSRAIAFVELGKPVKLLYDALPYQKFGVAEGYVARVSETTLFPQELGILSQNPEPVYKVEVALAAQSVRAFGQDIALQSGMELSADIVLEDRKLVEWLLEPLLSLR